MGKKFKVSNDIQEFNEKGSIKSEMGFDSILFGLNFNQSLESISIPEGIKKIKLNFNFLKIIKPNSFPKSLTNFKFSNGFSNSGGDSGCNIFKYNSLPNGLLKFTFPSNIKNIITNIHNFKLPQSITHLVVGINWRQQILPDTFLNCNSLTVLDISKSNYTNELISHLQWLPNSIKTLLMNAGSLSPQLYDANPLVLNSNITKLYIYNFKYSKMPINYIPKSIETLHFIDCININIDAIHENIKTLSLPNSFNSSITSLHLSSIEYLLLGSMFDQDLSHINSLPKSLKSLNIGSSNPKLYIDTLISISTFKEIIFHNTNKLFLETQDIDSLIHYLKVFKK